MTEKTGSVPWSRVQEIFEQALDREEGARASFVREASGDDQDLCALVLEMLVEDSKDLLEESLEQLFGSVVELPEPETLLATDREVGAYKIVRELGRGGMGVVYLATRTNPDMSVALKVVRALLAAPENLERFFREQEALARLEHPGIARFIDTGSLDDGTPYYAMEYVEGEAITAYCDRLTLGIDQRLQLFVEVCRAVDHAHRALVVHRDIKPSNVLVDQSGRPRLVDFGIAKLIGQPLGGDEQLTQGVAPLTPAFAAPEQIAGEPVTVATDVYGLGHLLFLLLTGNRAPNVERESQPSSAVDAKSDTAQRRGTTLSSLRRKLRGDLDNITMKALALDRSRRYPTASALLADVEHHLAAMPVSARAPTFRYRATRFVKRNRLAVGLATTLVIALLVSGILLTILQRQTAFERDRARLEAARAEQVADFLASLFEASDPTQGLGSDTPVGEFLERGTEQVAELDNDPAIQAPVLNVLAQVWTNLANYPRSEALWRRVIELHQSGEEFDVTERVDALMGLAEARSRQEAPEDATELYKRAFEQLDGAPVTQESRVVRAKLLILAAANRFRKGQFSEAEAEYREAAELIRSIDPVDHLRLGSAEVGVANTVNALGRSDEAEAAHERAIVHLTAAGPDGRAGLARVLGNLANTKSFVGDHGASIALHRRALAAKRELYLPTHPTIGVSLTNLANVLSSIDRADEAMVLLEEALKIQKNALGEQHRYYLNAVNAKGIALLQNNRAQEAEELYKSTANRLRAEIPPQDRRFVRLHPQWAKSLTVQGRHQEAEQVLRELLDIGAETMAPDGHRLARIRAQLGGCLLDQGRLEAARPYLQKAAQHLESPALAQELASVQSQLERIKSQLEAE